MCMSKGVFLKKVLLGVPREKMEEIRNYFEILQTILTISRNIVRIFVRQLKILE